jgi:hypothetical protein
MIIIIIMMIVIMAFLLKCLAFKKWCLSNDQK